MKRREIKKTLRLSQVDYYRMHIMIVSSFLPVRLTDREIDVLSQFLSFKGEFAEDRFGPSQRKIVMDRLGMKPPNLSKHLKTLRQAGVIKGGKVIDHFVPHSDVQLYKFQLVNEEETNASQTQEKG